MISAELKAKLLRVLKYVKRADLPMRAASVSYYAMISSIPLLAVVLTLSAQLLPNLHHANAVGLGQITTADMNTALAKLLPAEANEIVTSEISRIQSQPPVGLLSIGLLLSLWTASGAYMALIRAMNYIYDVVDTRAWWKVRLTAMLMPIAFAAIMIMALLGIIAAPAVVAFFHLGALAGLLMIAVQWILLYAVLLACFEIAYRLGPRRKTLGRWLSTGSIVGATIFVVASVGFQLYVQQFGSYDRVYGSLGGFIVFLVWMWMSSASLLLGCALNRALDEEAETRTGRSTRDLARQP